MYVPCRAIHRGAWLKATVIKSVDVQDSDEDNDKIAKYEVDHLQAFHNAGLTWPPNLSCDFEAKTQSLRSSREKELVHLDEHLSGSHEILTCLKIRDVNLSYGWGSEETNACPTILESSVMHVRGWKSASKDVEAPSEHICRVLSGEELLSIQGFGPQWQLRYPEWHFWSHQDKVKLAGNAFDGHVLVPFFTAMFACAPIGEAIRLRKDSIIFSRAGTAEHVT